MMNKKLNTHYEKIANLYLRLKGYMTTNLIIHSDEPNCSNSELDILGIRMPFHLQVDRKVEVIDYLESSTDNIEIIIADVKNIKNIKKLQFNDGLRKKDESIEKLINWIGITNTENDLINKFKDCLNLHRLSNDDGFKVFDEKTPIGKFTFKFTFFCPSLPKWNGKGFKYIHGEEMFDFIWECLNTKFLIDTCSRKYNFANWNEYEEYVRFFKNAESKITIEDFEKYFDT